MVTLQTVRTHWLYALPRRSHLSLEYLVVCFGSLFGGVEGGHVLWPGPGT